MKEFYRREIYFCMFSMLDCLSWLFLLHLIGLLIWMVEVKNQALGLSTSLYQYTTRY